MWWDGDHVVGKIEILPTVSGNILKALIENNVQVGVSSRGMGSLKPMGEGMMEVQDDFELLCWDFVSTPSNDNGRNEDREAQIEHLLAKLEEKISSYEEKEYNTVNHYGKASGILTEILCAKGTCPII